MRHLRYHRAPAWLVLASIPAGACSETPAEPNLPAAETVRVSYCADFQPIWVAFQDGDGPWIHTAPTATQEGVTFAHDFREDRAGLATLMPVGGGITALLVLYGEPSELAAASITKSVYCGRLLSKTIHGTVVGLDADQIAYVNGQVSLSVATPDDGGDFVLSGLGAGPHDLIAARQTQLDGHAAVTDIIVRRDVELADGASAPVLDFASQESFPPSTAMLTLNGVGPEGARVVTRLITRTTDARISAVDDPSPDTRRAYVALPADRLRSDDLQELSVSAAYGTAGRSSEVYFRTPTDRSLDLPAYLVRPAFDTVAAAPALRLRARFRPQPDFDRAASVAYRQGSTVFIAVTMTAAYASVTDGEYRLVVPDLSAAEGFDPTWTLRPGERIRWTATGIGGSVGFGVAAPLSAGSTRRIAMDSDTIPGS